ncbi:MAG: 4Fe-4S binding protein [Christensenellaceae bacterium]|jgi:2-oxoglutarate ferredoxin oxidoreductase subunit delta|nr:4Fe-4S binding protein [Christensenellaceae bacterium]
MAKLTIRTDSCKGCGLCVDACPKKILRLSETALNVGGYHPVEVTDESQCIGCASCAVRCPDVVIEVER